jgi:hypothetical protein
MPDSPTARLPLLAPALLPQHQSHRRTRNRRQRDALLQGVEEALNGGDTMNDVASVLRANKSGSCSRT